MSPTPRDARLDVAKGLLIILVVFGHLEPATAGQPVHKIYSGWLHEPTAWILTAVYIFHMPLFVALAGVTAKANRLLERVTKQAVLFVALNIVYVVPLTIATRKAQTEFLAPFFVLWFLLALIYWMLLVPVIDRFPVPAVVVSLVGALLVGLIPFNGSELTYSRFAVFLPFFVIGHLYGKQVMALTAGHGIVTKLGAVVAFAAAVTLIDRQHLHPDWLAGNRSFHTLHATVVDGLANRLGVMTASAVCCLAFLVLVPATSRWLETVGQRSLAIFLLHPAAIVVAQPVLNSVSEGRNGWVMTAVCVVLTAPIVAVLTLPVFDRVLRTFSENVTKRLLGRRPAPAHAA